MQSSKAYSYAKYFKSRIMEVEPNGVDFNALN